MISGKSIERSIGSEVLNPNHALKRVAKTAPSIEAFDSPRFETTRR